MRETKYSRLLRDGEDVDGAALLPNYELNLPAYKEKSLGTKAVCVSLLLNVLFLSFLGFQFFFPIPSPIAHSGWSMDPGLYSPASDAVEYVESRFKIAFIKDESPYQGWPDDEKDQLWQDMYSSDEEGMAIRIDEAAAQKLINTTEHAPVPGLEKDYMVGLDVFHQLHCLNMLRRNIYPTRYNSSIVREDGSIDFLAWSHLDHCIESIRESLTCSVDISAIPYRWHDEAKILEPDAQNIHMCRDFTKIRDWAFDRFIPMTSKRMHVEKGVLVDYSGAGRDPEDVTGEQLARPKDWNKTVNDL
ncbi:hypothetical protein PWT90_08530 [Aphanocladium album]|nr:hypothetical protein PWT90_08530 [Aphanocladium album]